MQKHKTIAQRDTVGLDDRRAVLASARSRKPAEVKAVPNEAFVRQQLKARLGWDKTDPAPESVKAAAKQMGASLDKMAADAAASLLAAYVTPATTA